MLKSEYKMAGFFARRVLIHPIHGLFSILTILNPPQEIITEFTVKSPVF